MSPARLHDLPALVARPLAVALTLLLFVQWPLRGFDLGGSTQANDLAQWLFAVYVAIAVPHAQARRAHVTARTEPASGRAGPMELVGTALCVLPWSLYLLVSSVPAAWASVRSLERFPETMNPGYFMTQLAVSLMALLMTLRAAFELRLVLAGPGGR